MKMKCTNCDKRVFDISKLPKDGAEIELKCPRCRKLVTISCADTEFGEDNLIGMARLPVKNNGMHEKILFAAMDLFSKKGFYETTEKEIADAVGIKESAIFGYFDSKCAILTSTMEYYQRAACEFIPPPEVLARLSKDATTDDVMACLYLYFPKDEAVHYIKALHVMFQEHCRNNDMREFFANNMIIWQENYIADILKRLVEVKAINGSINISFWSRLHVNNTYAFSGRLVLGIGEMNHPFEGMGMEDMLRTMYDLIFHLYGNKAVLA